jgi:hypothetical protein
MRRKIGDPGYKREKLLARRRYVQPGFPFATLDRRRGYAWSRRLQPVFLIDLSHVVVYAFVILSAGAWHLSAQTLCVVFHLPDSRVRPACHRHHHQTLRLHSLRPAGSDRFGGICCDNMVVCADLSTDRATDTVQAPHNGSVSPMVAALATPRGCRAW